MSFSIIIPTKDDDNVISCVRSILHTHPSLPPEKIIIIDDGLSIETQDLLGKHRIIPGIKPFVFARNCNLGIDLAGEDDVILLNDDTSILTASGFDILSLVVEQSGYGVVAAALTGAVGNTEQLQRFDATGPLRMASRMVCFVCVYIPRSTIKAVGKLDERFIHYGFDDDDYCLRVRSEFLKIGVSDLCVVEHGVKPSSYRGHGHRSLEPNQAIFREKWGDLR